jgi:rubrerythrin
MPAKECPLCGTLMRFHETESIVQVPGNPHASRGKTREWVCPVCDYYEEAEEEGR